MKKYQNLYLNEKKDFWKKNPITGEIEIKIEGINGFKMFCENDDTVVKELYWTDFKGWELTSLTLWNDLLNNLKQPSTILDVGSYSGIYAIIASQVSQAKDIFTFDIQNNCIDRINKNIEINQINNIQVIQAACSNENGEATFYYYEEDGIMSSVAGLVPKKMNNLETTVKSIRLDDWFNNIDAEENLALLKMDVEGAEQLTLEGMRKIINKHNPNVLIEINSPNDLKAVRKLFPNSYYIYDINENTMEIKKLGFFNSPSSFRNYLFSTLPKKKLKTIFSGKVK